MGFTLRCAGAQLPPRLRSHTCVVPASKLGFGGGASPEEEGVVLKENHREGRTPALHLCSATREAAYTPLKDNVRTLANTAATLVNHNSFGLAPEHGTMR